MAKPSAKTDVAAVPTLDQAATLLAEKGVDKGLWAHSALVAIVAVRLAAALQRAGVELDMNAVAAGGLLHDIAKGSPKHAHAGAHLLEEAGYDGIVEIVARHTEFIVAADAPVSEAEAVYLADKLVRGDNIVLLESRFEHATTRFAGDPKALAAVTRRRAQAIFSLERMARAIGASPEEVAQTPSGHPLENALGAMKDAMPDPALVNQQTAEADLDREEP
ncbi:HD domain-containing protein [Oceanidesulfovibrio marinus]|uniref:HD domain-containing protein n=1 Tax=Oceanidesulfovibrio marinus TaxID=370038 RepID=A0ABX6NG90_9BACT|nr:HD domain-containing protein [Oceanidesulfovibrio marinus]QJT09598.1 HD domain-containing protein [Oceanidesulfovibrio marinus]